MSKRKTTREYQLGVIHALKRDMELSGPAYRNVLFSLGGKRSSADMTDAERQTVIDGMRLVKREAALRAAALPLEHAAFLAMLDAPPPIEVSDEEALAVLNG